MNILDMNQDNVREQYPSTQTKTYNILWKKLRIKADDWKQEKPWKIGALLSKRRGSRIRSRGRFQTYVREEKKCDRMAFTASKSDNAQLHIGPHICFLFLIPSKTIAGKMRQVLLFWFLTVLTSKSEVTVFKQNFVKIRKLTTSTKFFIY